jgi:hypothetical protein
MTFYDRFELAQTALLKSIQDAITNHHNGFFKIWLGCEADMAFGYAYQNIFKEHFGDYITEEVKTQLWFAGKNILYSIRAFLSLKDNNYSLKELLDFVEAFISEQLEDFENDYDCADWFNDAQEQMDNDPA